MSLITVLGGGGYIGRHLVEYLKGLGHEVFVPKRDDKAILDLDLGHVVYANGLTANFRTRPFDTVDAHVIYLSQVLRKAKFKSLLYLSSTRLYMRSDRANEETPILSQSSDSSDLYNLSKLMGESLALNCGRTNIRVARLSNVVGGLGSSESFLKSLALEARSGEIVLQNARSSLKDYIHIDDAVVMLGRIAINGTHAIYNIAGGLLIEHGEWADALQRRFDCKVSVVGSAPRVISPPIPINRFIDEFSFRPGLAIRAVSEL